MSSHSNTTISSGKATGAMIFSSTVAAVVGNLNPAMPSAKPEIERPASQRLYTGARSQSLWWVAEGMKEGHTYKAMPDHVTRPELDASLAATEAKMDGRLARIEDKVDKLSETVGTLATSAARIDERLEKAASKEDLALTKSNLYKAINTQTWRLIGATAALVAAVFFIARYLPPAA